MYQVKIKYTDYNDIERTETAFFHLNKRELVRLQTDVNGGMERYIRKLMRANDQKQLMDIFENLIKMAYGEPSVDGKGFIKVDKEGHRLVDDWIQTEAYSEYFMKLMTDTDEVIRFINGIMPKDMPKTSEKELRAAMSDVDGVSEEVINKIAEAAK